MNNSIMIINPYWKNGTWCFDDSTVGLVAEPFVAGIPQIIDTLLEQENIDPKDVKNGFKCTFSATYFPHYTGVLEYIKPDEIGIGNWYCLGVLEGWLCPALFCYFNEAPKEIYVKVEQLNS